MSFTGKVVLITGASAGIGAATALHFAGLGASLAIVGRNAENLQKTAIKCQKATGSSGLVPLSIVADVNTDTKRIIDATFEHFGRIDVLVNNAGIGGRGTLETTTSLEQFDAIMTTNVRSVYHLTMLAVPYLIASGGSIVNVSSVVSLRSYAGCSVYGMSKAALDHFTRIIAMELAPRGVRCNSVNPAAITSDFQRNYGMDDQAYQTFRDKCKESHPIGRIGEPEEVAVAIAFLANNKEAAFITGSLLPIDGGRVAFSPL